MTKRQDPDRASTAPAPDPWVAGWLFVIAVLVAAMVLIGGATRLTDSGLSITEWDLGKGLVPPLTAEAWAREFDLYRQTDEYKFVNRGMALPEFQYIYWWEWGHRFFGKMIGVAFALPMLVFWLQGRLRGRLIPCLALFALGGLQGAVGWWMVTSGLEGRVDVAPYRLATHLGLAVLILGFAWRLALATAAWPGGRAGAGAGRGWLWAFAGLLFLQILSGAVMAGLRAGGVYPDWPLMAGRLIPEGWDRLHPAWLNLTENPALAHFNHRLLGYFVAAAGLALGLRAAWAGQGAGQGLGAALALGVLAQAGLGVLAVTRGAPLDLSLIHQAGAIGLWLIVMTLLAFPVRQPDTAREAEAGLAPTRIG